MVSVTAVDVDQVLPELADHFARFHLLEDHAGPIVLVALCRLCRVGCVISVVSFRLCCFGCIVSVLLLRSILFCDV